jgi:hypothetical protein
LNLTDSVVASRYKEVQGQMDKDPPNGGDEQEIIEPEQPREGTLAWLRLQPHVEIDGRTIPGCHRLDLDAGSLLTLAEDDGRCQYVRPSGERCGAPRTLDYGLCLVHSGGGSDLAEIGRKGSATKTRLRIARQALGIGSVRTADPRTLSRIRAQARAEEIAEALLAPLDADDLGAMTRQRAAQTILDALWPQQTVSLSVEVPADEAGVQTLGWREMQQLAAQLVGDTPETEALNPA